MREKIRHYLAERQTKCQAEAACKDGKTSVAASKAKEAMSLLK